MPQKDKVKQNKTDDRFVHKRLSSMVIILYFDFMRIWLMVYIHIVKTLIRTLATLLPSSLYQPQSVSNVIEMIRENRIQ